MEIHPGQLRLGFVRFPDPCHILRDIPPSRSVEGSSIEVPMRPGTYRMPHPRKARAVDFWIPPVLEDVEQDQVIVRPPEQPTEI